MTLISQYTAQQPVDDFSFPFASLKYSATLAASTDTSLVIPGNAPRYKALIKANNEVWISSNAVAAIPTGASFAATSSEMLNSYYVICRDVSQNDVIHFFTNQSDVDISVVLYGLPSAN